MTYGSRGRCSCCDLPVESCGRSAELEQAAELENRRRDLFRHAGVIPARYPGRCAYCGEWTVAVGDPLGFAFGGWVGLLCCGDRVDLDRLLLA